MIAVLHAELIKLRRSLVLLVALTPPLMVFLLAVLTVSTGRASTWPLYVAGSMAIWAFFLFPMSVIGITALMAHIEYQPGTWSHTLALPVPRWQIFATKAGIALGLCLMVSLLVGISAVVGGSLGGLISPKDALTGEIPWLILFRNYGLMFLAGGLLMAIQWTAAMQFSSFAAPVSLGIGGTFVAVSATSTKYGIFFPWLMPVNVMASDPARAQFAITLGATSGIIVFLIAIYWLSRRDWH